MLRLTPHFNLILNKIVNFKLKLILIVFSLIVLQLALILNFKFQQFVLKFLYFFLSWFRGVLLFQQCNLPYYFNQ